MFIFFGHSLDSSDKDYIDEVFNFVNKLNTDDNNIIVTYHNENSKKSLLSNLLYIRGKENIVSLMRKKN